MVNYPGLIDIGARGGVGRIPYEVYEDVRLTALLDGEMIRSVMTQSCGAADLRARQELFETLRSTPSIVALLRELYELISSIQALHTRLSASRCSPERHLLFLHLSSGLLRFTEIAAKIPENGVLLSRFASFFKAQRDEDRFLPHCRENAKLIEKLHCIREVSCCLQSGGEGSHLYFQKAGKETYLSRLLHCSALLGLEGLDGQTSPITHLPNEVMETVAQLHSECFASLEAYYRLHFPQYSEGILRYYEEIRFCLAIVDLCEKITEAGIPLCVPSISSEKEISLTEAYDITLLAKGMKEIVPNDASFTRESPFFYLTGANGGGKTTYLRTVAVSVLLFLCGAPVPCRAAKLYPIHQVFTHFPRDERFENSGRSADEERRMRAILREADGDALLLLNETYATTSEQTAIAWTSTLAEEIYDSGNFGIYVTHQHAIGEGKIPFLRVIVDGNHANRRTYKVERTHAEADSFARDILAKYRLDEASLAARFPAKA